MTYTQQHMLPCLYVHASSETQLHSQKESGFLSLVYICMYSVYTDTKVTYVHIRNLMSLSSNFIYVHVYLLPTYTYICHLYKYPYVKDTHTHAYVIHMYTWIIMIAHGICQCVYVHMLPTCIYVFVTYIHITYVTYIDIHMWAICI